MDTNNDIEYKKSISKILNEFINNSNNSSITLKIKKDYRLFLLEIMRNLKPKGIKFDFSPISTLVKPGYPKNLDNNWIELTISKSQIKTKENNNNNIERDF